MKKIISLLVVAVMLVLSLASCDMINKLLGKDEAKDEAKEPRTTITAEEWDALKDKTNYTIKTVGTSTMVYGEETVTTEMDEVMKSTETAVYEKSVNKQTYQGETDESKEESYSVVEDGVRYLLHERPDENGVIGWIASEYDWEHESIYDGVSNDQELTFEDLVYDEEKKAYTYTLEEDGVEGLVELYFEDGNLVKMVMKAEGESGSIKLSATVTVTVSDIGTTKVDVPKYTVNQ